jgi:hypothetical protein
MFTEKMNFGVKVTQTALFETSRSQRKEYVGQFKGEHKNLLRYEERIVKIVNSFLEKKAHLLDILV